LLAVPLMCWSIGAIADDAVPTPMPDDTGPEQWAIHGQITYRQQLQPAFRSPFQGPQSLPAGANGPETFDATVYLGYRPWQGAEIWLNPEADQGFGLGNSFGVARYLSGEAYKLGQNDPYYRMARAFFRQTIDLGGSSYGPAEYEGVVIECDPEEDAAYASSMACRCSRDRSVSGWASPRPSSRRGSMCRSVRCGIGSRTGSNPTLQRSPICA
jgi:hypothetical protein